jgi:orotidine-5'-phosphate decarboxylase
MGRDSVKPFLKRGHWAVVLGLTSNPGSEDFQQQRLADGQLLWEHVLKTCLSWGTPDNLMFVTGATKPEAFEQIRAIAPDSFLLVPGIGAQGGDLNRVLDLGLIPGGGLLINSSRSILYASRGDDYAEAAAAEARKLRDQMADRL